MGLVAPQAVIHVDGKHLRARLGAGQKVEEVDTICASAQGHSDGGLRSEAKPVGEAAPARGPGAGRGRGGGQGLRPGLGGAFRRLSFVRPGRSRGVGPPSAGEVQLSRPVEGPIRAPVQLAVRSIATGLSLVGQGVVGLGGLGVLGASSHFADGPSRRGMGWDGAAVSITCSRCASGHLGGSEKRSSGAHGRSPGPGRASWNLPEQGWGRWNRSDMGGVRPASVDPFGRRAYSLAANLVGNRSPHPIRPLVAAWAVVPGSPARWGGARGCARHTISIAQLWPSSSRPGPLLVRV